MKRPLIIALVAAALLSPYGANGEEERWKAFDLNQSVKEAEAKDHPALDPYQKASWAAVLKQAQIKQREAHKLELKRAYNVEGNESSSNIDLGVVTDLPGVKLRIHGHVHYFFEGRDIPELLDDKITMTFNISAEGEGGMLLIRRLEAILTTNKLNEYRPKTDGMGSVDEDKWSYTHLVIMDETSVRRLLEEELGAIDLGLVLVTKKDRIVEGLKMLVADMDDRRK